MNRIERLTATLLLLQERPHTSGEIARQFEVSKRTVLRDVQALCEMGIPIVAREGRDGGYSLATNYLLAPLPLTVQEAFLLLLALSSINRLVDVPFASERASLMAKIRALLPEQALPAIEPLLAAVEIDVPARTQQTPFLEPLIAAAREQCWVKVAYRSARRRSVQHLFPRRVSTSNGLWYCHAFALEHQAERWYRVDRIEALAPAGGAVRDLHPPDPTPYEHDAHPRIVARLTARGVALVESEPHLGARIDRHPDGTGSLSFHCPPDELDWYARYFAGLGPEVEVREPDGLRERLARLGRDLLDRYRQR